MIIIRLNFYIILISSRIIIELVVHITIRINYLIITPIENPHPYFLLTYLFIVRCMCNACIVFSAIVFSTIQYSDRIEIWILQFKTIHTLKQIVWSYFPPLLFVSPQRSSWLSTFKKRWTSNYFAEKTLFIYFLTWIISVVDFQEKINCLFFLQFFD